jgi:hypothetical protein
MSSSNRGERIETLQKLLKKHYKPIAIPTGRNVLENLIYSCLLEDAKFEVADELFAKAQHEYHDWNEARVTTITELAELFAIHPLPVQVAVRLKKALQAIFEARYSYDIEDLLKLNLGKAIETVEAWVPTSKFVSAFMQQNAFGGHAIAIDNSTMQALVSTGVAQSADMMKGSVSGLDRAVAKAKGPELFSLVHQFGVEFISDRKAPGVQAIMTELGIEIAIPKPAPKPTRPIEKAPPAPPPAPPAPAPSAKKTDKKEPAKEIAKEPPAPPPAAKGQPGKPTTPPKATQADKPTGAMPPAKPAAPAKVTPPVKPVIPAKPSIPAKPPLQIHVKNATKPDAAKGDAKSGGKSDAKGKAPPPKAASKDVGPKSGKGDTKKPGKAPPPPPAKPTKKGPPPPASNKGIAKKKPK